MGTWLDHLNNGQAAGPSLGLLEVARERHVARAEIQSSVPPFTQTVREGNLVGMQVKGKQPRGYLDLFSGKAVTILACAVLCQEYTTRQVRNCMRMLPFLASKNNGNSAAKK